MELFSSDYLAHHGILGQKWGIRNGPPYPLHSEQKARAKSREHLIKIGKVAAVGSLAAAGMLAATFALSGSSTEDLKNIVEKKSADDILSLLHYPTKMSAKERLHVCHEIMTNMTHHQRYYERSFVKCVGSYTYVVSNDLQGNIDIIGRVRTSQLAKYFTGRMRY